MLLSWAIVASAEEPLPAGPTTNALQILGVNVDGKAVSSRDGSELRLGPSPENISIGFGPPSNSSWMPVRLHYKLEGYDNTWRRGLSEMFLTIRFYNDSREIIDQKVFSVEGDSSGWNGSLKTSSLTHRRETLLVPPQASRLMAVISSAGPPSAVGIYVVDNLSVSRISPETNLPKSLLQTSFDLTPRDELANQTPKGWVRDGTRPAMAKIVELGRDPKNKAFAIVDDDRIGHAEWHTDIVSLPLIAPSELLVIEWNELFSVGVSDTRSANYHRLPPGNYRFCVQEESVMGVPTGPETSVSFRVLMPWWKQPWFWASVGMFLVAASAAGARYRTSYKLGREMVRLQQQRELEQERLRIARDIHDDLGARVTQISMLSAMAPDHPSFPQNARTDFDRISLMSREMVSALYETVWAVNPENDNLSALGNYLRQVTSQLCEPVQLRCRLHIPPLPRDIQVSSQIRHNITMAVKEAVHNVIKHANASEVILSVAFSEMLLTVSVQDNGCGLPSAGPPAGNGLPNMQRRLQDLGGSCLIESLPGRGTSVKLTLVIQTANPERS